MSRQLAARLGSALGVRSGSKVDTIDQVLRAYSRQIPPAAGVPLEGSVAWGNVTGKPAVFEPAAAMALLAVQSPAALGASTDNWNPTDLAVANVLRVTTDGAGSAVTGLVAPGAGFLLALVNLGPAALTLAHEDTGSSAVNRFAMPGGVDLVLGIHAGARLWYDAASERWRALVY